MVGRIRGAIGAFLAAVGRFLARVVPPTALACTLLVLGALAWPTEEDNPLVRLTANLGSAASEASVSRGSQLEFAVKSATAMGIPAATDQPNQNDPSGDPEAENGTGNGAETETGNGACFTPLFRDDFDGDRLGDEWTVYDSPGNHSTHAVRRADAIQVADGNLVITARNNADGVAESGGMRHNYSQTYGRYRFRVRTDADPSQATSGVILTWPVSESQPLDGENNMYETLHIPGDRKPFYSYIHEPFDASADGISQTEFAHLGDATRWQELSMDWTPDFVEISWYNPENNRIEVKRLTETAQDLITDAEHFLAIQLDLFKGTLREGNEVRMEVDWVEVYSYCGNGIN